MTISVASGKGGTGKTTIAVSLALTGRNVQFLDCDVEEPNAHIFLKPKIEQRMKAHVKVPKVDKARCDGCGKCREFCAYNAIAVLEKEVLVYPQLCHGCGGCALVCPKNAITETDREIGEIETGDARGIPFTQGRLNVGEAVSPPLIKAVKEKAEPARNVIIDAPPGTSCPVVEAVSGSDFCILAAEATPFGLNDLTLAADMLEKLAVPFGVVLNRSDMGDNSVTEFCAARQINLLMKIPFDIKIAQAYAKGMIVVEALPEYCAAFERLWEKLQDCG